MIKAELGKEQEMNTCKECIHAEMCRWIDELEGRGCDFFDGEQEPCTDAVSREAVLKAVSEGCFELRGIYGRCEELINALPSVTQLSAKDYLDMADRKAKKIKDALTVTQKSGKWIALVTRPMTNEEREYYSEQLDYCDGDAVIYNCPLPEEGQDVLITTCTGAVLIDTFFNDYDGCGFEGYDIEDVKAWMPLPKPYEPQESEDIGSEAALIIHEEIINKYK